ncbi:MAG: PAS domain S-box protein [Syntrophales bacterium]|jgi:PAS domain S-box-containing protein
MTQLKNTAVDKKKAIRDSEQRFRHIFEHSPAMVYLTDVDGVILDMNVAGARMLGYHSPEDLLGVKSSLHVYADSHDRERFREIIEQTGSVQDFETRFRRRDGTVIDVRITATIRKNKKGGVAGYEGFVIDVTDRKQAERALQDSEEKYRTVVENSLSAIFIHQGGLFRFVNHRFAEMLGYDNPEDVVGRPFWDVVHPIDRAMVKERGLRREKAEFSPARYIFRGIKKDGTMIWVDLRATHATYMGRAAVVGNLIDITQNVKAEEEIRNLSRRLIEVSEDEKKRLAADLHDEFGQSLTSLHFDLEYLERSIPQKFEEQKKGCERVIRKVERLADSVRKTTSYLRPDLLDHLGLVPALEWSIHDFTARRTETEVDFQTLGLKKRLNPKIELALYRLFQECMTNISKHAKATRVEIMLTYSHPRVIFIVRDNGVGHEPSKRGKARGKALGGIGLLSMRERVASLGGSIDIASSPGKGTTIRAEIPVG